MGEEQAEQMARHKETEFDVCQYANDGGLWTIVEIVKRPVAKVASRPDAHALIKRLATPAGGEEGR